MLIPQIESRAHLDVSDERPSIKRVEKEDMKERIEPAAPIYCYYGSKRSMMLAHNSIKYVLPVAILASQQMTDA